MYDIVSAILPVFLIAAASYLLARRMPLDVKTLSTTNLYLFIPTLVYSSLSDRDLQWDLFARVAAASALMVAAMTVVLALIARARGLGNHERTAFILTLFPNLGNFGLPVCTFAFGPEGMALAVVVMVCGSFLQNTVGIYYAQRSHHSVSAAFRSMLGFPMMYAFALALLTQRTGIRPPLMLDRAIDIAAGAAIPVQIIILGVQLQRTRLDSSPDLFLAAALRLIGGPILAAGLVLALGFDTLAAKVFIVQMAGPVAVAMTAYGVQFDVAPRFLASVVAWTFLLSLFTVSAVLYLLSLFPG